MWRSRGLFGDPREKQKCQSLIISFSCLRMNIIKLVWSPSFSQPQPLSSSLSLSIFSLFLSLSLLNNQVSDNDKKNFALDFLLGALIPTKFFFPFQRQVDGIPQVFHRLQSATMNYMCSLCICIPATTVIQNVLTPSNNATGSPVPSGTRLPSFISPQLLKDCHFFRKLLCQARKLSCWVY